MRKRYTTPPLIEAVCEYRFSNETDWDLTIPGIVYAEIREEFPKKSKREIQLIKEMEGNRTNIVSIEEGSIFLTEDEKFRIQMGNRLLSVFSLKPYSSWEIFKQKIEYAFNALFKAEVHIKGVQRIGLRYINKIEIPEDKNELKDYFNFRPQTSEKIPKIDSFELSSNFIFSHGRDSCRVRFFSRGLEKKSSIYVLDLDYYLKIPQSFDSQSFLFNWIEEAHNKVEELFEGCISDKLREIFGEVKR